MNDLIKNTVLWFNDFTHNEYTESALIILNQKYGSAINIIGATCANESLPILEKVSGFPVIPINSLKHYRIDLIVICGSYYSDNFRMVLNAAREHGIHCHLIPDRIICIPEFDLDKHCKLLDSNLSIVSLNCFGGLLSHLLTLPFNSPFVNCYMGEAEFVRLLNSDIYKYLQFPPRFLRTEYNPEEKHDYPILDLCGFTLNMLHYRDAETAIAEWMHRCLRMNRDNCFFTMYTDNEETVEAFDALPYSKKACFTTFESTLESAYPLTGEEFSQLKANERVNYIGWGLINSPYNLWDMLLDGKKEKT